MIGLQYTTNMIAGFKDFGGGERSANQAKYALIFNARGSYANWKMPLACFLSSKNVFTDTLVIIVKTLINKLYE